jgi:type IV secretory pathway TrbD component
LAAALGGIPVGLIASALNLTGPAWIAALLMVCCWSASSIAARLGSPE